MSNTGSNVWFDLMTTDPAGAVRFYTEAIGWKTEQWASPDDGSPYTMWLASTALGGVMELPDAARKMGAPPQWLAYTTVVDLDASVAKAVSLGAQVLAPAMDMPGVGRFASLADPQGAVFAMFTPSTPASEPPADELGQFRWAELNTADYETAWAFYTQLFDWHHRRTIDLGPSGPYLMWHDASLSTKGGMCNAAKLHGLHPHWLHYITVADINAVAARIQAHGGKVLRGPTQVPGGDWVAQCQDPQGAFFALFAHAKP